MADGPANEAGISGRCCARPRSGPICISSASRASRACGRSRRPPAGAITVVSIKQMYAGHAAAGDGARGAMHRRRLFLQICRRGRRRRRPDRLTKSCGRCDTFAAGAVDRILRETWSTYLDPSQNPPGNPAVGVEVPDQRLHGIQIHQTIRQAHKFDKPAYERWWRAGGKWASRCRAEGRALRGREEALRGGAARHLTPASIASVQGRRLHGLNSATPPKESSSKGDIIATTQGRIIPTGKSKLIQPFETGVVRAIEVADGASVKEGDVLVELDPDRRRVG